MAVAGMITKEQCWELIKDWAQKNNRTLIQRGHQWFMLCPFHPETDPSLTITPELGLFKCFGAGCGVKGTIWKLARMLGLLPTLNVIEKLIKDAWERQEEASTLVYRYRSIVPEVAKSYGVGGINLNSDSDLTIIFPHPHPHDFHAYVSWHPAKGYKNSKGLDKTLPFGLNFNDETRPVFVVEGVFDCMSLAQIGILSVATLGEVSIVPLAHLFKGRIIIAPDNDFAGQQLFWTWVRELRELRMLGRVYCCLWKHKDANDALRAGTLMDEVKRVRWLPPVVIVKLVMKNPDTYKSVLPPFIASLTPKEREEAIKDAEEVLRKVGLNISLGYLLDIEQSEPEWMVVLKAALRDRQQAEWIVNQPNFSLAFIPDPLRKLAIEAIMTLEGLRPPVWVKSPFGLSAVKWAYQQAQKFVAEQLWREILKRWNLT
ncbi:CHC2 zinc finger domain-containing protein (plasmid) [Fervidibacter sacchari]|uniref:Zinc finger CHC2-type domain-containing protein n=1 Tax=Candidatus Fervidibacter sacchari TaxID=1448929 RepID=A0ABT2ETK7_9BACT|nr:CHC2 zinc finger domain-containing protein [Candidatus Fervidibacter sacchari]MCS3921307.1 hypothetical protein [Candidatus Fervidibacter sacchari]WKU18094.1 CHC2 zinc finger domain-containing protein [Candidatus Fervidibacter sacchari]